MFLLDIFLYVPLILLVFTMVRATLPLSRQTENMSERTALRCVSTEAQTTAKNQFIVIISIVDNCYLLGASLVSLEVFVQFSALMAVVSTRFAAQSRRLGDARTAKQYYQIAIQLHRGIHKALLRIE
jgi:hypothetical protein